MLRDLDLKGLRVRWRNVFGKPAPEHLTRYLLFRIIAYRLQADRLGDLDAKTIKVLEQAAGQQPSDVSKGLIKLDQRRFAPPPGTVLVREWDRTSHQVMVVPDGYAWNGKTFDSLSQVAASSSIRSTSTSSSGAMRRQLTQPLSSPTRVSPSQRLRSAGATRTATEANNGKALRACCTGPIVAAAPARHSLDRHRQRPYPRFRVAASPQ